ncbi:hypothetical protein JOY44_18355 [Phormidium sp. CLA17]|uniref:hypothetical protein n=1 Tax=Leptolyngbya sp. Cla-17 TaxID=2803751 RepID=UPI001490D788|nr:hypothetical protein [Leptolyngbya sp. Cla-17]MBM0743550.1 hypothetical protein [Leptolyngbya sp. Cla-17]
MSKNVSAVVLGCLPSGRQLTAMLPMTLIVVRQRSRNQSIVIKISMYSQIAIALVLAIVLDVALRLKNPSLYSDFQVNRPQ